MHNPLRFIYKNPETLRHIFLYLKMYFALCFYIQHLLYHILWYLIINVNMIRAIRSIHKFDLFIVNWSYYYDK